MLLLEADRCGFGPSGRNGGFVNSMWFSLPTMRALFSDERALAVARAAGESIAAIGRWCEEQEVDAWFTPAGYVQASTSAHFDSTWEPIAAACRGARRAGDGPAARSRRGPATLWLAALPRGGLLPAGGDGPAGAARRGPANRLLDAGVRIHERTPVVDVAEEDGGVVA